MRISQKEELLLIKRAWEDSKANSESLITETPFKEKKFQRKCAANKIIKWSRFLHKQRKFQRFLQNGKWTKRQSDLILSYFILGPRVRKIMNCFKIKSLITRINDLKNVLTDILQTQIEKEFYQLAYSKSFHIFSSSKLQLTDLSLAKNLSREYVTIKREFYDFIFKGSIIISHIIPGYVDLSHGLMRSIEDMKHQEMFPQRIRDTPPRKHLVNESVNDISHLDGLLISPNQGEEETISILSKDSTKLLKQQLNKRLKTVETSNHQSKQIPKQLYVSESKRNNHKAHLQIDLISADKLMPAKKGSANRDLNTGEVIADRRPCIKLSLYLPALSVLPPLGEKPLLKKVISITPTHHSI